MLKRMMMMGVLMNAVGAETGAGGGSSVANAAQVQANNGATPGVSRDDDKDRRDAIERARQEERRKLNDQIAQAHKARTDLEAELARRDEEAKKAKIAALPPDQQMQARMTEFEHQLARERAERVRVETEAKANIRSMGLVAYRERALRDAPAEVHHLIGGSSEEEIDEAVDRAVDAYRRLEESISRKYAAQSPQAAQHQQQFQGAYGQVASMPQGVSTAVIPAPPQNPAYVAQQGAVYGQGGFPSVVNPLPVTEAAPQESLAADMRGMTSEAAVRSGRYGGEMRERIHAQLRGRLNYQGQPGNSPRYGTVQPHPHVQMAGNVAIPQGSHVAAPTPVGMVQGQPVAYVQPQQVMYQQPVYQQPVALAPMPMQHAPQGAPAQVLTSMPAGVAGQGANPLAQAQAAVARTHAGANPMVNSDGAARSAFAQANAHAAKVGVASPQQAFAERFAATPPVPSGQ